MVVFGLNWSWPKCRLVSWGWWVCKSWVRKAFCVFIWYLFIIIWLIYGFHYFYSTLFILLQKLIHSLFKHSFFKHSLFKHSIFVGSIRTFLLIVSKYLNQLILIDWFSIQSIIFCIKKDKFSNINFSFFQYLNKISFYKGLYNKFNNEY